MPTPIKERKVFSRDALLQKFKPQNEIDFNVFNRNSLVDFISLFVVSQTKPTEAEEENTRVGQVPEGIEPLAYDKPE